MCYGGWCLENIVFFIKKFTWVIHRHIFEREVNKKFLGFAYMFFAPLQDNFNVGSGSYFQKDFT